MTVSDLEAARYQLVIRQEAVKPCEKHQATAAAERLCAAYQTQPSADGVFAGLLIKLLADYPADLITLCWQAMPMAVPKNKFDVAAVKTWLEGQMKARREHLAEAKAIAAKAEAAAKEAREDRNRAEFKAWFRWWRETHPDTPSLSAMTEHYAKLDEAEWFPPWTLGTCDKPTYAP